MMFWRNLILLKFILHDRNAYSLHTEDAAQKSTMFSLCIIVIPRLTKIILSGIIFVSRNLH